MVSRVSQNRFYKDFDFFLNFVSVSALHLACTEGNMDVVEQLVDMGADVNQVTGDSKVPLYHACHEGHTNLVQYLTSKAADINWCPEKYTKSADSTERCGTSKNLPKDIRGDPKLICDKKSPLSEKEKSLATFNRENEESNSFYYSTPAKCQLENIKSKHYLVYTACKKGHVELVEMLFNNNVVQMTPNDSVLCWWLLGAEYHKKISVNTEFVAEVDYSVVDCWSKAIDMAKASDCQISLPDQIKEIHLKRIENSKSPSDNRRSDNKNGYLSLPLGFLCSTTEDLLRISEDDFLIALQVTLVLEAVLGPAHLHTNEMSLIALSCALNQEEFDFAFLFYLYLVEKNIIYGDNKWANTCMFGASDELVAYYRTRGDSLSESGYHTAGRLIGHMSKLTRSTMNELKSVIHLNVKLNDRVSSKCNHNENHINLPDQFIGNTDVSTSDRKIAKKDSVRTVTKIQSELSVQCENMIALLWLMLSKDMTEAQEAELKRDVRLFLSLENTVLPRTFSIHFALLRIVVYGGVNTSSTLYFYQEDMFPHIPLLKLLIECGINVNCSDCHGNTPLHFGLLCPTPSMAMVKELLNNGAHIDACNFRGISAYSILGNQERLQRFNYMSLKCFAAQVIAQNQIPYHGNVPTTLEGFISVHWKQPQ